MHLRALLIRWNLTPILLGTALGGVASAGIVFSSPEATAKSSYDSAYGFDRTWNAALRLVRIDLGFKITEKDDSTGYLMFEYKSNESGNKASSGSLEFIRGREADASVKVVVQLPEMPRYHEQVMIDSLSRKLRQEYGDPPAKRSPPPPSAPQKEKDAGAAPEAQDEP